MISLWTVKLWVNIVASVGFMVGGLFVLTCPFPDLSAPTRYIFVLFNHEFFKHDFSRAGHLPMATR